VARFTVTRGLLAVLALGQLACLDSRAADATDPLVAARASNDGTQAAVPSLMSSANLICSDEQRLAPAPPVAQSIDLRSVPPVDLLLGPYANTVGTRCGFVGLETDEWLALTALIHTGDREALRRIAGSAATCEGRVLGIAGLYQTGEVDEHGARGLLSQLHGHVRTCGGCIFSSAPASTMMEFILNAGP